MFGWSMIASAWRSASKRATTWPVSMPGLMTLSATLRRTGCVLLGHEDGAHAAFADFLEQLVWPDDGSGAFGDRGMASGKGRIILGTRVDRRASVAGQAFEGTGTMMRKEQDIKAFSQFAVAAQA